MAMFGASNIEKMKMNRNFIGLVAATRSNNPEVCSQAIQALGELAEPWTADALIHIVRSDKDKSIRITAIHAISSFHENENVCDALITTAKYNQDADIRYEALCAFQKIGKVKFKDELVELCFTEDKKIGGAAVLSLFSLGDAGVDILIEQVIANRELSGMPEFWCKKNLVAALDGEKGDHLLGLQSPLSAASIEKLVNELACDLLREKLEFSAGKHILPHVTHVHAIQPLFDIIKTDNSNIMGSDVVDEVIKAKLFFISILENVLDLNKASVDETTLEQISGFSFIAPKFRYEEFKDYALYHPDGTYVIPTPDLIRLAQEELKLRSAS